MRTVLVLAVLVIGISAQLAASDGASAGTLYPAGGIGYDISQGQCGASPDGSFGVVSATAGRAFSHNACLAQEFATASARAYPPSLYMNIAYPAGTTAWRGLTGPKGNCAKRDKACQAYNYGYNDAADAVAYATGEGASGASWWIDIETANTWSKTKSLNQLVIQGALDYFSNAQLTAGVYSTSYQWGIITGGMQLAIPNWVAGASSAADAASRCSSPFTGSSGSVWLVQYPGGAFDADYAC